MDRNPKVFAILLEVLRTQRLVLGKVDMESLQIEADYFGIILPKQLELPTPHSPNKIVLILRIWCESGHEYNFEWTASSRISRQLTQLLDKTYSTAGDAAFHIIKHLFQEGYAYQHTFPKPTQPNPHSNPNNNEFCVFVK